MTPQSIGELGYIRGRDQNNIYHLVLIQTFPWNIQLYTLKYDLPTAHGEASQMGSSVGYFGVSTMIVQTQTILLDMNSIK